MSSKAPHPEIPWSRASEVRHRLVRDCEGTNWNIVIQVIFDDLLAFIAQILPPLQPRWRNEPGFVLSPLLFLRHSLAVTQQFVN